MKTKQEQVDKMAQAMCAFCTEDKRCVLKYSAHCREVASQDCTCKESAEELICKGYGDVTEYKAEIERLKSEIKQAQIDVLNKLKKKKYYVRGWGMGELPRITESDIDELIKEVEQNERI